MAEPAGVDPDSEAFKIALGHAWDWFSLHSAQRMQLVNYFIAASAFITAAYASSISAKQYPVAVGAAAGGILLSVVAERLDARTRELIKLVEVPLRALQEGLATRTGVAALSLVELAEKPARRHGSYRSSLRILTRTLGASFAAALAYALVKIFT